jgi:hypothetical protein
MIGTGGLGPPAACAPPTGHWPGQKSMEGKSPGPANFLGPSGRDREPRARTPGGEPARARAGGRARAPAPVRARVCAGLRALAAELVREGLVELPGAHFGGRGCLLASRIFERASDLGECPRRLSAGRGGCPSIAANRSQRCHGELDVALRACFPGPGRPWRALRGPLGGCHGSTPRTPRLSP